MGSSSPLSRCFSCFGCCSEEQPANELERQIRVSQSSEQPQTIVTQPSGILAGAEHIPLVFIPPPSYEENPSIQQPLLVPLNSDDKNKWPNMVPHKELLGDLQAFNVEEHQDLRILQKILMQLRENIQAGNAHVRALDEGAESMNDREQQAQKQLVIKVKVQIETWDKFYIKLYQHTSDLEDR